MLNRNVIGLSSTYSITLLIVVLLLASLIVPIVTLLLGLRCLLSTAAASVVGRCGSLLPFKHL